MDKELCPRQLEDPHLNPIDEYERAMVVRTEACKRLKEAGAEPYFDCRDCRVVVRRKTVCERVPRF